MENPLICPTGVIVGRYVIGLKLLIRMVLRWTFMVKCYISSRLTVSPQCACFAVQ